MANFITNSAYIPKDKENEVNDLEGLTFDSATRQLYIVTSQTKRNRYRDVDNIDTDPVIDPPSNDYDRRRNVLLRLQLDTSLTNVTGRTYWESESNAIPGAANYDATNGMVAFIRQRLATNAALGELPVTNRVLIARNTANKFGTPINGVSYAAGTAIPYTVGGLTNQAGSSLGEFSGTSGFLTNNGLSANTWYYYKVWASNAATNYTPGIVASNKTDGLPKLFINEFMAQSATNADWIEIYNSAPVPVDMQGLFLNDDPDSMPPNTPYPIPNGVTVPGRGYIRFVADSGSNGVHTSLNSATVVNIFD